MKLSNRIVTSVIIVCAVFLLLFTAATVPCGAVIYKIDKTDITGPDPEPNIRVGEPGDYGGGNTSLLTSSAEGSIPTEPEDNKKTPENIELLLMRIFWQQLKSSTRIFR